MAETDGSNLGRFIVWAAVLFLVLLVVVPFLPDVGAASNQYFGFLTPKKIQVSEVDEHMGRSVAVCGKVVHQRDDGTLTFLNFGAPYPNQDFAAWGPSYAVGENMEGKRVCVRGPIYDFEGTPQIKVRYDEDIFTDLGLTPLWLIGFGALALLGAMRIVYPEKAEGPKESS